MLIYYPAAIKIVLNVIKSIGYTLDEAGCDSSASIRQKKPRREIRRHKFSVIAAQVSPLSRHLLLTRINIPPGLITQYSYTWMYMRARVSEMRVIVPVCNTSE